MVDCLSCAPAMEGLPMIENTTVRPVMTEWLSVVAYHLDLDSYILFGVATLCAPRLA